MANYGYARTSTTSQQASLEHQQKVLLASGVLKENLVVEEVSAVATRPALEALLKSLREGDALVVTTLSRLARSTKHLLEISETLHKKGCSMQILDFSLNTATAQGKMVLTMLAAVAEMERTLMLERQAIGVAKAKAEGKYKGRPGVDDGKANRVKELKKQGLKANEIAAALSLGVSTVYKILADQKPPKE
jgi:DNA invertase Pin-like site-specific DNA recombinase